MTLRSAKHTLGVTGCRTAGTALGQGILNNTE